MTVSPLSIFIREKNSAKYINYNRSAWNHRIAAYEDLSGYEQADVDCSGDQCTEDKSECISGCTEGSECGKSGAGAAFFTRPRWFDLLMGNSKVREDILKGKNEQEIKAGWKDELDKYKEIRKKYLLYK